MKRLVVLLALTTSPPLSAGPPSPEEAARTHWAFQPVVKPIIPKGESEIDGVIDAALAAKGIPASPSANRATLARRVSYDLRGLPPSRAEVEAFLADETPNAYERLVDRYLASPQLGVRWGRYWLDVTRYADSKGYVFEEERRYPYAYTYRDWVVDAFNRDLPYDHFLIQQIAGDYVAKELGDNRAMAAMGAFTLGRRFLNKQADIIDDRIDVLSRGMLGLTVACARCHDHKFDPVPTEDYYSLYGVFASSSEPTEKPLLEKPGDSPLEREFQHGLDERQNKLTQFFADKHANLRKEETLRAYLTLAHEGRDLDDDAFSSAAQKQKLYQEIAHHWRRFLKKEGRDHCHVFSAWRAYAELSPEAFASEAPSVLEKLGQNVHPLVLAEFRQSSPKSMADVAATYARLLAKANSPAPLPDRDWENLRQMLVDPFSPTGLKPEALYRIFNTPDQQYVRRLRREVEQYQATAPTAPPRGMPLVDNPEPTEPVVFIRGSQDRPGKQVPRQFLAVLSGPKREPFKVGSGRFELAKAVANKANPLTARVFANRLWLGFFGQALVDTTSDFGVRTERPALGDALDYLAWQLMEDDWSIKRLQRRVLLSAAYQRSSMVPPGQEAADPENRLLARMNRRRLDFEAFRDSILAASDGLDARLGGQPVEIVKPPFSPRRSIYGFIDRQNLPAMFRSFDFANPDAHSPKRFHTTVPQQALFLLNGDFIAEHVTKLASQARGVGLEVDGVRLLHERILARHPSPEEMAMAKEFLTAWRPDPSFGKEQATTAWDAYAQVLLCSNEFMFVD